MNKTILHSVKNWFLGLIMIPLVLFGCNKSDNRNEDIDEGDIPIKEISIINKISFEGGNSDVNDFNLISLEEEKALNNTEISSKSYTCNYPQLMLVTNGNDEIVMMSRGIYTDNSVNQIDAQSTAIALVTMHPLFAPTNNKSYPELINTITSSAYFTALQENVKESIRKRKNIYDENNLDLLSSLSTLMEDLCNKEGEEDLNPLTRSTASRTTTIKGIDEGPFYVEATNGMLIIKNSGLTPMYEGTVTNAKGAAIQEKFNIPSRSDYGALDLLTNRTNYGEEIYFKFADRAEGEYHFHFDRTTFDAATNFYVNIAGNLLCVVGLPMSKEEGHFLEDAAKFIWNAVTAAGSGLTDNKISPLEWCGIAFGGLADFCSSPNFSSFIKEGSKWGAAKKVVATLGSAWNWYNKIKGSANLAMRIGWSLNAPEIVDFCLCYYNKEVSSCSTAELTEISGNHQEGYAGQRLLLPLVVKVRTTADDGSTIEGSNYQMVKFIIEKGTGYVSSELVGTGQNQEASTYWYLGKDDPNVTQKIKAIVVDLVTGQEISNPIYFEASIKEPSDITIRLDWDATTTQTDIDLHVIDPFGEEIYYKHKSSASGGWLDRDDVVGPGPEHIYWKNAPAGSYQILVHHFNSESKGVIGYRVTTYANGKIYKNVGSVAFRATDYVGTLTIPSLRDNGTRSMFNDEKRQIEQRVYPEKKQQ